jgi:hypothetical protein
VIDPFNMLQWGAIAGKFTPRSGLRVPDQTDQQITYEMSNNVGMVFKRESIGSINLMVIPPDSSLWLADNNAPIPHMKFNLTNRIGQTEYGTDSVRAGVPIFSPGGFFGSDFDGHYYLGRKRLVLFGTHAPTAAPTEGFGYYAAGSTVYYTGVSADTIGWRCTVSGRPGTWVAMVANGGGGGGATDFTDLGDVPSSYSGQANKVVSVKADESGLEFTTPSGGSISGLSSTGTVLTYKGTSGSTTEYYVQSPNGTYQSQLYIDNSSNIIENNTGTKIFRTASSNVAYYDATGFQMVGSNAGLVVQAGNLFSAAPVNDGVGIGIATPSTSAKLNISTTTKFPLVLNPMTATQASAITPVAGALVAVSNTNGTFTAVGLWYYNGSAWTQL